MPDLLTSVPRSETEPVTDIIHGVSVTDPYRWLEDQESPRTRQWLIQQTAYTREYLDGLPGRERIRSRIREFLEIETYDSLLVSSCRYVFRKRRPNEEQPCIYTRDLEGDDRLLIDPATRATGKFTAVKPLVISPDGQLLVYEVKDGGERASRVELIDIRSGAQLPDTLPHGYLRAFGFSPDSRSFYYAQEPIQHNEAVPAAIYQHKLGTSFEEDELIFQLRDPNNVRLGLTVGPKYLLIIVSKFDDRKTLDCYLKPFEVSSPAHLVLSGVDYLFGPRFVDDRLLVITNKQAPNLRVVEFQIDSQGAREVRDVVPARDALILNWAPLRDLVAASYLEGKAYRLRTFDFSGREVGEIPLREGTTRLITSDRTRDELFLHYESFFQSPAIHRHCYETGTTHEWTRSAVTLDPSLYDHHQGIYASKDGTQIPIHVVGRKDVLERECNPTILTSYGGFRHVMTPQFSVFVSFLMEKGCVFALPAIRGGGDFGPAWHEAAKRRKRQNAFDDFLSAAEWLIESGISDPKRIGIFGGSNSGLLVGAALTQAPELFRAALFNAPLLDMLRYHLFNGAVKWVDEFGTSQDPDDFPVLWSYSPYHRVRDDVAYPAVMMISGDSDQNCNPLHARKMVARLQAGSCSRHPIILDYNQHRGHSPVLPLSMRIDALTDRMAFFCAQLGLAA